MKKNSVFLRAFETDDYLLINKWRNDFEVQRNVVGRFRYVSLEREKNWVLDKSLNDKTNLFLAICLNDDSQQMIGYTSIIDIDYVNCKAFMGGIVMAGESRNSKNLTDAYLLIFDHVFVDMSLHRLEGSFLKKHTKAILLNKMMGWTFEGIDRDAIFKEQQYHDLVRISILDSEYFRMLNNGGFEDKELRRRLREAKIEFIK